MDLGGNIGTILFIWFFPISQGTQLAFLVALGIRELVEMLVSIGVMTAVTGIFYFNRFDYYIIDVVSDADFRNAWIMALIDFGGELVVFIILDRMVYRVWKLSLFDLAQAYIRSIGNFEIFSLTCTSTIYIFLFMNYHYGCDYFWYFEWLTEENLAIAARNNGTISWCEMLQNDGFSCYNFVSPYNETDVP